MKIATGLAAVAAVVLVGCGCGTGDGGGAGGGSAGGGAGGGAASTHQGVVTLNQFHYASVLRRSFSGVFFPMGTPASPVDPSCTATTTGACTVTVCDGGAKIFDGGQIANAGTLAVNLGGSALFTNVKAGPSGVYIDFSDGAPWDGGEPVQITGTGDAAGVPGFTVSLAAPSRIELASDGGSFDLTPGAPFSVGWNAGDGNVFIDINASLSGTAEVGVSCTAQASAGSFTVPAAVTQAIPPGGYAELSLLNTTRASTAAGSWSITALASSSAKSEALTVH